MSAVGEDTSERYHVLERLAEGGMAVVDRAVALGPGGVQRELVLKRIRPRFSQNPRFARMFIDEARIVAQLIHPNIVHIYEFGTIDGDHFLAMEYVPGVDLARLFKRLQRDGTRFPLGLAVFITVEVCRALDYAHRKRGGDRRPLNIVHRDVSPQNVLVSHEGAVKLADFGIAHAAERREQTMDGMIKGKVAYMSPEQLRGENLDGRSDLFSASIVLYLLLTGTHPYVQSTDGATIEKALLHDWPPPSQLASDVPSQLDAIVARGTARLSADRFSTAGELAEALEGFLFDSRLRATAGELATLMKQLYGEEVGNSLSPTPPPDLEQIIVSELRRIEGNDDELPQYTLAIPAQNDGPLWRGTEPMFGVPDKARTSSRESRPVDSEGQKATPNEEAVAGEQFTQPMTSVRWQASSEGAPAAIERSSSNEADGVSSDGHQRRPWAVVIGVASIGLVAAATYFGLSAWSGSTANQPGTVENDSGALQLATAPIAPPDTAPSQVDADRAFSSDQDATSLDAALAGDGEARGVEAGIEIALRRADDEGRRPPRPTAQGWIRVVTRPHYAEVYIDGRPSGTTPLVTKVRVGRHRLRLVNPQLGRSELRVVNVRAGDRRESPVAVVVDGF